MMLARAKKGVQESPPSLLKPIIISPPFGTYLNFSWATSVKGTWTAEPRKGSKILRAMKTIRRVDGGWVNRMGLLNKGMQRYSFKKDDVIYSLTSVSGEDFHEWDIVFYCMPHNKIIELNVSCPNATLDGISKKHLENFHANSKLVIIKLPPDNKVAMRVVRDAVSVGITHFHCCNTLPSDRGGISGEAVKSRALFLIMNIKREFPDTTVIGGGGIYTPQDVRDYREVGADHFSLATIWFTPWKVDKVINEIYS